GTSAVAWMAQPRGLVVSTGDARGRFTTPEVIVGSRATDWSVAAAPGGAALVAWEDRAGAIRAAVRSRAGRPFVVRRVAAATGSPINGLQVAADPRGGWVVAERRYPRRGSALPYSVRALSLDADGRALGAPPGPTLAHPGRAFAPTGAYAGTRAVVVFELKDAPAAFSPEAPVRAVAFGAGGQPGAVQTLSRAPATEPVALGLAGGRALA